MNRRFFVALFAFAAVVATPFLTRAQEAASAPFKNYSRAGATALGSRPTSGAQLGFWDPAVSGSIDTGYIDTAACRAGCMAAMIEVETATTALSCTTYGAYDKGSYGTLVSAPIGSAVSVSASSQSWANSVCPGAATSGGGLQFPLPKYVRIYCAAVAGVNARAFMSCH
jgi:hypothetical protein